MRRKLTRKYLPLYYYQENITHLQLSKKSSYQTFSSTRNHIDSHNPPTHQPIFSFKPQHNTIIERNTRTPKCFLCQGYGHIALDCPNHKSIAIFNGEIDESFEEEKEDIHEAFEEESIGEPIYDEEYVGADIFEVFKEEGNKDRIYDDEYGSANIHEVFEKEEKEKPIYDEDYLPTEYDESLEVKKSLQTTDKDESCLKHNTFHSSYTSQGKVSDIIIDSRYFVNVVSNNMVEKLKLLTKEDTHPCNLQLLNKDNEDVTEIKLTLLLLNEFNERKEEFKPLKLLVTKEQFKEKTKLYMPRPVPKPPWEQSYY
jgi:hypothetical protein